MRDIYSCDWNGYTVHTAVTRQGKDGTKSMYLERVPASLSHRFSMRVARKRPRAETSGRNRNF